MRALRAWLSAAASREERRPSLFGALLSGRIVHYAYHRLRFMLPRTLLGVVLHAVEVYLLSLALPWEYFAPLLSYRAGAALIAGSHWGALEALRRRVRDELGAKHPERARRVIEAWLFVTSLGALLASLVLGTLLVLRFDSQGFSLFDAYGVACFVRLVFELVTSTYHSGIYASRRVYRPLVAAVVPDLLELVALVLLWRPLGAWGIALSIVLIALLRGLLTWYYADRTYARSRMGRPRLRRGLRALSLLSRADLRQAALHAVSNGGSQLDALLLLVLARAEATAQAGLTLGIVYAFRPVLSLAHGWPRAFYPDLKLVERGTQRVFIERLHQLLQRTATWVAGAAAIFIVAASSLIFAGPPQLAVWLLAGLCLVRSHYAVEQLEAFAFAQHGRALRLALPVVLVLAVCGVSRAPQLATLAVTVLALATTAVLSGRLRVADTREVEQGALLALPRFFAQLERAKGDVFSASLTVDRGVTTRSQLARALLAKCDGLVLTKVGAAQLACYAPASSPTMPWQLIAAVPGALRELQVATACAPGSEAAAALRKTKSLAPLFGGSATQLPALLARFKRDFPGGNIVLFARLQPTAKFTPAMQRAVLQALGTTQPRAARSGSGSCQVAVYAPRGTPEAAFIVPLAGGSGASSFASFSRDILQASLAAHA